jgi:hypothetical protein
VKNILLRKIVRKIIVERIQLIQEGKKKFFVKLVNDKKMSQENFNSMFKPNGDFKYPFNDIHFRYVLFNTINTGENHSFEDIVEMYEIFKQQIFVPFNQGVLRDVRIPGESFQTYPINSIIQQREGTYDSLNSYIQILNSMNARTSVLQKILDEGFKGDKKHFEVIYMGDDWIVVYPKTYLGSIATARMGPDKKYYTPPKGIGKLSWCTSVDSAGNAFLNYHRRLNLHMYYFTKIKDFSPIDSNKKICVSIAKKGNHISVTKDSSTVDGNNDTISEKKIESAIGKDLLNIIKKDAASPSRPEIDEKSYYRSISIEIYKDMRKANEENMELFVREVRKIAQHTENLDIAKDMVADPNLGVLRNLVAGYSGQSKEITSFLFKNEDRIISRDPSLEKIGIFQDNVKYVLTLTPEKFVNDLPEFKNSQSPLWYGSEKWIPMPGLMMRLFRYNRSYEIANAIIKDDVRYLKLFIKYASKPEIIKENKPYQKAIQDNIEYIIDNVPEVAELEIEGVVIPFGSLYRRFASGSLKEKVYFSILRMCQSSEEKDLNIQKSFIESTFEEVLKENNEDLLKFVVFGFYALRIKDNDINKEILSKFSHRFESITNIPSSMNKSDEKIIKLINDQKYKEALQHMIHMYNEFGDILKDKDDNSFRSLYNNLARTEEYEPQLGNLNTHDLKALYVNQYVMPAEDVLEFIKKNENSIPEEDLYYPIISIKDIYKRISAVNSFDTYSESGILYSFGHVGFSTEENLELDEYIKALNDVIMSEGYVVVSKPYFQEKSTSSLVFPFGKESHLFNPDEAFIIKHYGDIFV